jgi:hypothetical protein
LLAEPTPANLRSLADALNELDARVLNDGSEGIAIDARMLPLATLWQFGTSAGDVTVLRDAQGAPEFADLRGRSLEIELGPLRIPFASREDLIRMKRAAARPVDLADIAALRERDGSGSAMG